MKLATRALLIRQDWDRYDLSKYTDEQLVNVWTDWFLSDETDHTLFIEDLKETSNDIK